MPQPRSPLPGASPRPAAALHLHLEICNLESLQACLGPASCSIRCSAAAKPDRLLLRHSSTETAWSCFSRCAPPIDPSLGQRDGGLFRSTLPRLQGPPLEYTPTLSSPLSLLSRRSSFRLGWPAARGGAAVVFTVHEAWPADRARRASGRGEAARWRAGGPDGGRLAVSSPVEALRL